MPLIVSDELLIEAGLSEQQARIEFACRLFDIGKLNFWPAAQLAGLDRVEFERELRDRKIPIYRPSPEHLDKDLAALDRLGI
jgi:predicted HTH domain antitoxin